MGSERFEEGVEGLSQLLLNQLGGLLRHVAQRPEGWHVKEEDNALLELSREADESNGWLRHCCIGRGVQVNDGERRVQVELPYY